MVNRLLDAGWSLEARDAIGNTPLTLAAWNGRLEVAKCLLLWGANIDTQNVGKWAPLHGANGHTDLVQLLLQCGASQEIRNNDGKTAEDYAKNDEIRSVFRKYKKKKEQSQLLQQAIDEKNFDVAVILIFRGASLEGSDTFEKLVDISKNTQIFGHDFDLSTGITYKKIIYIFNNVPRIRQNFENFLILNIEVKEEDTGDTLLHAVAASDNEKLLKFLLNNGASTTQFLQNKKGQIPLEISKHNKYIVELRSRSRSRSGPGR